jgi:hypothetical protein
MELMITKASTPLFEGSSMNMLSTMLLNLKIVHGVSNVFMDKLFSLLKMELLPKGNNMPTTIYEALKLIKELGLNYDSTHNCTNGCVFFRGTLKDCKVYPKCNTNRYMEESQCVPWKVLQHFLLILRLLQMYMCKTLAELLI